MFIGVCPGCGKYQTGREIEKKRDVSHAVCKACGHEHPFQRLPLFIATGPSGTGKTTICLEMGRVTSEIVCLDGDILLREEFAAKGWDEFRNMWMELAANISQSGRPVLLFLGGTAEDFRENEMAIFFQEIHVIGIYANDEILRERLTTRPAWRDSGGDSFIESMLKFNAYAQALPERIDTSFATTRESAEALWEMIKHHL